MNRRVTWTISPHDRRRHPELPKDATVTGRLVVRRVQPGDGGKPFLLALFTTLELKEKELLATYGQRWKIGVSSQGHMVQSVRDRPGSKDSDLVAGEAPWRESKTVEPFDKTCSKGVCAKHQVATYSERRRSLVTRISGG